MRREADKRVTVAKARRTADIEVQKAATEYRKKHARRKMVTAMADIMERNAALISRELSRRISTSEVQGRSDRWRA